MVEIALGVVIVLGALAVYFGCSRDHAEQRERRKLDDRLAMMRKADVTRQLYRATYADD